MVVSRQYQKTDQKYFGANCMIFDVIKGPQIRVASVIMVLWYYTELMSGLL